MITWFRRLADVPKLGYQGNPDIDRSSLPHHNAQPEIQTFTMDGKRHESLMWRTRTGSTSASPAQQWETRKRKGESPMQTQLRRLYEALELPGELSDYHFALLRCYEELWKYRREEPWFVAEIERLCLLDIALVETYPEIIVFDGREGRTYAHVPAFHHLMYLYEQNGYLYDALDIARRAVRMNQGETITESIQKKVARLEEERVS